MLPLLLPDWLQRESLKNPCNVASVPDPLIVSTICHAVLQCSTFTTVSVTLQTSPIIDGRHRLTLQERWDGSVLASIVAFFFCYLDCPIDVQTRSPLPLIPRTEGWSTGQPPMSMLVRCCPTRSHKQRRQDRVCPPMPTPKVTIYRSDGACRGQGTIAETLAGWGAAVWSADARGLGAGTACATARGVSLEMTSPLIKLNILPFFSVCFERFVCRTLVIFEVDSLILAQQLARHLPWACRSEKIIALHQQCVHVCDFLSALRISRDIRHIYREFNQTAKTLSNQAIGERDLNGVSAFW